MKELSHFDSDGKIKMVDVGGKNLTSRVAVASGRVLLNKETIEAIRGNSNPKGDPLEIARIAGIIGAKKTSELIPLCHQIALSKVDIDAELQDSGVYLTATAATDAKTGVEMEALTAIAVAALTVYDMCKAVQRDMEISNIRLESKTGGKADYIRNHQN